MKRLLTDIVLIIVALTCPWWLTLAGAVLAAFYFSWFVELPVIGLIIDSLYNAPILRFHGFELVMTLVSGCILLGLEYIKTVVRFE